MILVADNLRITNPVIERAIMEMNPKPVIEMVIKCTKAGAKAIDLNCGPLTRQTESRISFLVKTVQKISDLPILLDTANPVAIEAGLKASQKKTIINGFSLEPAKLAKILPLAKKYQVDIIGYLLHPNGQVPQNTSERLDIALNLFLEFQKTGLGVSNLIIDPIIAPLSWQNGKTQNREILKVIQTLPELLGFPVRIIAGLSNLTAGGQNAAKNRCLEKAYLSMLAAAGLDTILLNILHPKIVQHALVCDLLLNESIFTWEEIPS